MTRELAETRGDSNPRKGKTAGSFKLATDHIAADFEAWAARAGIIAPKLRIADFDGERRSEWRASVGLFRVGVEEGGVGGGN